MNGWGHRAVKARPCRRVTEGAGCDEIDEVSVFRGQFYRRGAITSRDDAPQACSACASPSSTRAARRAPRRGAPVRAARPMRVAASHSCMPRHRALRDGGGERVGPRPPTRVAGESRGREEATRPAAARRRVGSAAGGGSPRCSPPPLRAPHPASPTGLHPSASLRSAHMRAAGIAASERERLHPRVRQLAPQLKHAQLGEEPKDVGRERHEARVAQRVVAEKELGAAVEEEGGGAHGARRSAASRVQPAAAPVKRGDAKRRASAHPLAGERILPLRTFGGGAEGARGIAARGLGAEPVRTVEVLPNPRGFRQRCAGQAATPHVRPPRDQREVVVTLEQSAEARVWPRPHACERARRSGRQHAAAHEIVAEVLGVAKKARASTSGGRAWTRRPRPHVGWRGPCRRRHDVRRARRGMASTRRARWMPSISRAK